MVMEGEQEGREDGTGRGKDESRRGYNDGVYIRVGRRRTPTRSREMTEFATARPTLPGLRRVRGISPCGPSAAAAFPPGRAHSVTVDKTVDVPSRLRPCACESSQTTNALDGVRSSRAWHSAK